MLPEYKTERLLMRQRTLDHQHMCLEMDKDPEVTRYIPGIWDGSDRHVNFLKSRIEKYFGPDLGYWSVFAQADPDTFLGWILLLPYDGDPAALEIGWRFHRHVWGKGYATEAARAILTHALGIPEVLRVVADVHPQNAASIRVAEKIGLKRSAEVRRSGLVVSSYSLEISG